MLSEIYKRIIITAMLERAGRGEDVKVVLDGYANLTPDERVEILKEVRGE